VRGEGGEQYQWIEENDGKRRRFSEDEAIPADADVFRIDNASAMFTTPHLAAPILFQGIEVRPPLNRQWQTTIPGMNTLAAANRLMPAGKTVSYVRYLKDFPVTAVMNLWTDTGISGFGDPKVYVVQTNTKVIERCMLMSTDPGDLVLDPTCGSGTTAYVAEQ